jgi:hypothetical protein
MNVVMLNVIMQTVVAPSLSHYFTIHKNASFLQYLKIWKHLSWGVARYLTGKNPKAV